MCVCVCVFACARICIYIALYLQTGEITSVDLNVVVKVVYQSEEMLCMFKSEIGKLFFTLFIVIIFHVYILIFFSIYIF